jgi:iron complex outermembrane recepter protein
MINPVYKRSARCKLALSIAAITLGGGMGNITYAQEEEALEEIVVTGSRIRRQDYDAATAVATFGAEELNNLGIINAGDALQQIPSNVSRFTPANTGGSAFQIGANLADLRGLNPFFGTRTMTLVNTRRHVSTNQGGSVDLNFIPSVMINRMETVTGGASASYGADAISGVVNVILEQNFEGVKLDVDFGVSGEGDGENSHVGFAWGTSFADGRGHFMIGGETQDQDVIQDCSTARDWCAQGNGLFSNGSGGGAFGAPGVPFVAAIPGQPQNVFQSDLRLATSVYGRTFNDVAGAQTYRFNDAGTDLVPFDAGQYSHLGATGSVIGGEGKSIYDNLTLMPELSRQVFMANGSWEFSDTLSGNFELSYGNVEGTNIQGAPQQNTASGCVTPANGYLNMPGVSAAMVDEVLAHANTTNFFGACFGATPIAKDWSTENVQRVDTDTEVTRIALGLEGTIFGDWNWDAYYQYGETERSQIGSGYRTNHRFAMAIDTEINPMTNQPDCRVNIYGATSGFFGTLPTGADPSLAVGCVPLNPFGLNNASPEALAYAWADLTEFNTIELNALAFNLNGEIWEGFGAGAMQAAFGIEYRTEDFVNDAGPLPLAIRTDFGLQYGDAFAGNLEATEYFAEFELPLLSDIPLAELLTMNVAIRQSEYTNEGGILNLSRDQSMTTWKVSGVWDVNEWVRVRGSVSQDARAATYRELYYSQTIPAGGFFGAVTNPWLPDLGPFSQRDESQLILGGNVDLEPEEADTKTLGFVITPTGWIDGLQFSADYYEIELTKGISLGNVAVTVEGCFDDETSLFCDYMTFAGGAPSGATTDVLSATALYENQLPYNSSGIDLALNYTFPVSDLFDGAGGDFSVRVLSTHSLETIVRVGAQNRDIAGQTGGPQGFLEDYQPSPDWSTNLIMTYMNGPFMLTTQGRYVSKGILNLQTPFAGPEDAGYDPTIVNTVTSNRLSSHTIWNLNGSYTFDIGQGVTVYGNVTNLFDKAPPFSAGGVGGVNAANFDALGRTYRFGVRSVF